MAHRLCGIGEAYLLAVQYQGAGVQGPCAEQPEQQIRLALPLQSAQPDDFSRRHAQRRIRGLPFEHQGGLRPLPLCRAHRSWLGQRVADHVAHDGVAVGLGNRAFQHGRAIAHHRHAVSDGEHLVHAVRDENRGDAVGLAGAQYVEKRRDLPLVQSRRRLIQDHQPGAAGEDFEQLHDLPLIRR